MEETSEVDTFQAITGADRATAEHVLEAHGWDLNRSVNFFMESAGMPAAHAVDISNVEPQPAEPPEDYMDIVDDGIPVLDDGEDGISARGSRPPIRSHPTRIDSDDEDINAALRASLRTGSVEEAGPATRGQSANGGEGPIDLGEDDVDDDVAFVSSSRPAAMERASRDTFLGMPPGFLDEPGGRRVRRSRPRGAAAPDLDLERLAAFGGLTPPSRSPNSSSPLRPLVPDSEANGHLHLPDGINVEEARMLEAAMLGVPYEGRIPDFSRQRLPPEPTSPSVLRQRELRDEQEQAYQESLQADRRKAAAAEEAKRAEEAAVGREREAAAAAASAQAEYESEIADKLENLPEEPAADETGAVSVMVRLPNGKRFSRRFLRSQPLRVLFDFVDVNAAPDFKPGAYRLVTQFPRRLFEARQEGSLGDAGFSAKQEALLLELL